MLKISQELIISLNGIQVKIEVILTYGSKVCSMTRYEFDQQFMDALNFSVQCWVIGRKLVTLDQLIPKDQRYGNSNIDIYLHHLHQTPPYWIFRITSKNYQISPAQDHWNVLPEQRIVVFFDDLQRDIYNLLQLDIVELLEVFIRKDLVYQLTFIQRDIETFTMAKCISRQDLMQQIQRTFENWLI